MKKYWKNNIFETLISDFYFVFLDKKKMTDKLLMGKEYKLWNKYKKTYGILDYFSEVYTEERRIKKNEKEIKINKKK